MKGLIVVLICLTLLGCSNYNGVRSGKLRKVCVERRKEVNQMKSDPQKPLIVLNPKIGESQSIERELIAINRDIEVRPIDIVADSKDNLELCMEGGKPENYNWNLSLDAHMGKHEFQRVQSKSRNSFDWAQLWWYLIVVGVIVAIIFGLIFEPTITLAIIAIALVVVIILIVAAIINFFSELFDAIFGLF